MNNRLGRKLAALTFDDGPNVSITPLILDKLEAHGVTATFFVNGKFINEETKPVLERELLLGCEIGNHSWSHPFMNQLTAEEIIKEFHDTNRIIYETVGATPKLFRPPYFAVSDDLYAIIDFPIIGGFDSTDWDAAVTAEERIAKILNHVKDGDIILLHDFVNNTKTVEALDKIIEGLLEDGYTLVTVSRLFELKGVNPIAKNKLWSNIYC